MIFLVSVNTDSKKIEEVLSRGVVEVIDKEHLKKRMLDGEKLRIKFGIDLAGPEIHIGRGSTIKKLREFQELGHQIVLIIGDGTSRIGDSSDKTSEREMISVEKINENKSKYLDQIGKILDIEKTEVHHNSEWIDKFTPAEWIELASLFTLQQMIERENFSLRIKEGNPVGFHEALYPLLQGYDSVAIKADVEVGGTDQLFNLLAGRKIQKHFGQDEQDVLTLQLIAGTDGRKMSTSWGNTVLITEEPSEKYGRIMRIADQLIPTYMESATDIPMQRIEEVKVALEEGGSNPMEFKKELAYEIVKLYDGEEKAEKAQKNFESTIQNKELPDVIPSLKINSKELEIGEFLSLLVKANLIKSKSEGRRLIEEGAVAVDNKILDGEKNRIILPNDTTTIRVGKRRFLNLKVS